MGGSNGEVDMGIVYCKTGEREREKKWVYKEGGCPNEREELFWGFGWWFWVEASSSHNPGVCLFLLA